MSKYTLFDLFVEEVKTNIGIIKQCLPILKNQPFSQPEIERAIQASHSLYGTTYIMEMEAAYNLVQLIKDCLIAAQKQTITLKIEHIDILIHASDLLLSMSLAAEDNLDVWMKNHLEDWNNTQQAIAYLITGNLPNELLLNLQKTEAIQQKEIIDNNELLLNLQKTEAIQQKEIIDNTAFVTDEKEEKIANIKQISPITDFEPRPVISTSPVISAPVPPTIEVPVMSADSSSMMDLFRLEAEAQVNVLNSGLLIIENNPQSAQELEALMRAAHSIKGAARIVELDQVVQLAHVMEDCFVAAQNKTIALTPDDVDILLQGVDLLQNISQLNDAELPTWLGQHQGNFINLRDDVAAILAPGSKKPKTNTTPNIQKDVQIVDHSPIANLQPLATKSASPITTREEDNTNSTKNQDRVVRVSADNLNRIMGLAGESLIEANWLQPFADSMMLLKSRMLEIARSLEQLQESLDQNLYETEGKEYLLQARQQKQECIDYISDHLNDLELYVRRTGSLSDRLYREVINSHMRPFEDGLHSFPRMIRDLARKLNKQVKLEIIGKSTPVDRDILKKLEAPLTHILRNAVDHGMELPEERISAGKPPEGTIRLEAFHRGGMLAITISDDGKGINREQLRQKIINKNLVTADIATQLSDAELMEFLFLPGFSTAKQVTEISGRGVGLDIAKSMAQEVGGTVRANSHPGKGTSFHFQLPLTLSVVRTLLVEISENSYAIPLARIDQIVTLDRAEITNVENRQYFTMNNQNIGLIAAYQILELSLSKQQNDSVSVVVISDQNSSYGLVVDKFLGERDLVVRPLDPRLGKVADISATALLGDGSPILIVDVSDMVRSMDGILKTRNVSKVMMQAELESIHQQPKILVVDDSITVREMERKLLENRGYLVDTAVNGVEGWNAVRTNNYDLVISDIDMPKMNGIELVKQIKSNPRLSSLPIIIISYRDREEDRLQGLEAGADYYLTKSSFHDDTLINAVVDLIGN